jgi:tetratricopeptide (TPR) repeat protein
MKLSLTKAHCLAAAVAGVALCAAAIGGGACRWHDAPAPFVWLDVAVVHFVAALPLAASLAAALLQLSWRRSTLAVLGPEAIALLVVPALYVHARCKSDLNQAVELSRQSRYGETSVLLHRILALQPDAQWGGTSVALAAANTDEIVHRIEEQIAAPFPETATDADRIHRAQQLAMLGRNREAIALLDSTPSLADSAEGCNLRGTIHETQGQWLDAREWYTRAKTALRSLPGSRAQTGGLAQAITGIAFCERKLGRLHEAEAAWQELLALAPTADTHFLLAQFYEDTQQAAKAQFHARQAMTVDPERYSRDGQRLLDKLITSHFGCLGVFDAEHRSPSGPIPRRPAEANR